MKTFKHGFEATLTQFPNQDCIKIAFNQTFSDKKIETYGDTEANPKWLKKMEKRLSIIAHDARVRIGQASISIEKHGVP